MSGKDEEQGYIVEYYVLGKSVKVTAFDPVTLKEAVIVGSTKMRKHQLTKAAIQKLDYVIRKAKDGNENS